MYWLHIDSTFFFPQFACMTMQQLVVLYGQQALWHIAAGLAVFRHVCHSVLTAFKPGITEGMTSTCFVARQVAPVTVVT